MFVTGSGVGIIRCVGAITRDAAGRVLLVQRANDPGRGRWSLPGGKVEPRESDPQALAREMREETGLEVRVGDLVGSVERPAPNGTYVIFDYSCQVTGGRLHPGDDASDVAWVDADTVAELDKSDSLSPQLAETLHEWGVL